MPHTRIPRRLAFLILALLSAIAAPARADNEFLEGASEFALTMGYANISLGSSSVFDSEAAFHFEPSLTFSPIQAVPQLRLGTAVGVSMVLDNSERTIISSGGAFIFHGSSDIPFWTLEPEVRLSWMQTFGDQHQFFLQPGIAGGVAFGFLDLDSSDNAGDSYSKDDSTFYGRVFLRAGAVVTGGTAGIEASWLSGGQMDFGDNAAGDLSEFYIGIFGALYF